MLGSTSLVQSLAGDADKTASMLHSLAPEVRLEDDFLSLHVVLLILFNMSEYSCYSLSGRNRREKGQGASEKACILPSNDHAGRQLQRYSEVIVSV